MTIGEQKWIAHDNIAQNTWQKGLFSERRILRIYYCQCKHIHGGKLIRQRQDSRWRTSPTRFKGIGRPSNPPRQITLVQQDLKGDITPKSSRTTTIAREPGGESQQGIQEWQPTTVNRESKAGPRSRDQTESTHPLGESWHQICPQLRLTSVCFCPFPNIFTRYHSAQCDDNKWLRAQFI
jgi:hypothetical protein